jgi:hypothetical protein
MFPMQHRARCAVSSARACSPLRFIWPTGAILIANHQPGRYIEERFQMPNTDPWLQIVQVLQGHARFDAPKNSMPVPRRFHEPYRSMATAMANASSIRKIEWQTTCTILISWSDSTLGRFDEQTWRAGFARAPGICGLTGMPVRRGDPVFRPLPRGGVSPTNALDMIRADTLIAPAAWTVETAIQQ